MEINSRAGLSSGAVRGGVVEQAASDSKATRHATLTNDRGIGDTVRNTGVKLGRVTRGAHDTFVVSPVQCVFRGLTNA